METIKLWARNGDAVRQAIELGELVHIETASEELTDAFLLFAIQSGLLSKWARRFPIHVVSPRSAWRCSWPHTWRRVLRGCMRCVKAALGCVRPRCWGPWVRV